jgi:hypothetical protein
MEIVSTYNYGVHHPINIHKIIRLKNTDNFRVYFLLTSTGLSELIITQDLEMK